MLHLGLHAVAAAYTCVVIEEIPIANMAMVKTAVIDSLWFRIFPSFAFPKALGSLVLFR